jgi:hypothetical protein
VFLIGSFDLDIDLENYWFILNQKSAAIPSMAKKSLLLLMLNSFDLSRFMKTNKAPHAIFEKRIAFPFYTLT